MGPGVYRFSRRAAGVLRWVVVISLLWAGVGAISASAAPRELRVGVYSNEPKVFVNDDGKASGILSFGVKNSDADPRAAGARFLDALQLFTRLVNIGDAKSLATHPASTTHRQLNPEELAKAGVSEGMVRLSVGIEHINDLQADLAQALDKV